jgi:hypothetical protein
MLARVQIAVAFADPVLATAQFEIVVQFGQFRLCPVAQR